ncbi:MAG: sialate O-acetylesterase, partial [Planctomycetota bacterium]|nr:sialate O-acetylesterase [Planctomycetota bacterium]
RGRWSTTIRTGEPGGPYELLIASESNDTRVLVSDVMIGEVWVCSGQSNMAWPNKKALNPELDLEDSKNYPNIRFFNVANSAITEPQSEFAKVAPWVPCSPETMQGFSATAYQFAKQLNKELKIPIGLINSSWGGTRCEAWTPEAALQADERYQPLLKFWADKDQPTSQHRPGNLYNAMIAPLKGYAFRGVIWYQGEANVGRGAQYEHLFPTMIKSWRSEFNQGDLPFYFVQLAPFRYNKQAPQALPEVWQAQLDTLKNVGNTGMVVTTDIGNVEDIHPKNKQEVGKRLARWALADVYQNRMKTKPEPKSGPIFKTFEIEGNKIRVQFDHIADGLKIRSPDTELTYFLICGEDEKFVPATAEIDGETVIVSSPDVAQPVAVRFAWEDTAVPNLINSAGLPASPFRTDNFERLSKGVDH